MRLALIIYGVLNAILYASLLPLWDGFDEPFHYGYVQTLARNRELPALKKTVLSEEIWQSLSLAPASARVKLNLPQVMTFEQYFRLSSAARAQLRMSLNSLPPSLAEVNTQMQNYEAQHPPLAYAPLALAELLLKNQLLVLRVWSLRLICAIGAVFASVFIALRLAAQMGVPSAYANAALFVVLSSQMFYGATAHVANDWLAIPLFAFAISASIELYRSPSARSALGAALVLAAGLLTKSYFLAMLPVICGLLVALAVRGRLDRRSALVFVLVLLVAAGPWYARNIVLYNNLSGMQETSGGVPVAAIASAALEMPWGRALVSAARGGLWTGNNSFTAFSASASFMMLGLVALGLLIYGWRWAQARASEKIAIAACVCYVAALSYAALLVFLSTRGESVAPPAWHVQALLMPGWVLLFLGLSRAGRLGRVVAIAITCSWTYLILSTYFAKLIPFYAGYPEPSVRLARLWSWYSTMARQSWEVLNDTTVMPASVIFALAAMVAVLALALAAAILRRA